MNSQASENLGDELTGTLLADRYFVESILGEGQMGVVFLARDKRLMGRPCALKLLKPGHNDQRFNQRFQRECQIMARLHSPYIVELLDTGETAQGCSFLVMELLEGRPLALAFSAERPLPPKRALEIFGGILRGLAVAHDEGIIHRDLSLNNIFLIRSSDGKEHPKILDFGLAKDTFGLSGEELTRKGVALGTPTHMSPEQFRGEALDGRSDLYAAGILLYRMLAGHPPFRADSIVPASIRYMDPVLRIGWQHLRQAPNPIPGLDSKLERYLHRFLTKRSEERISDAHRALEEMPEVEGDPLPSCSTDPLQDQDDTQPSERQRLSLWSLRGLLLFGALTLILSLLFIWSR